MPDEASPGLRGQPLRDSREYSRVRVAGVVYALSWAVGVLAAAVWLDGGARVFVLILLALINPAGAWGAGYANYRRNWEKANSGGLADATSEQSRVLDDGRELRVVRLPDGTWQAWLAGTAPLIGRDRSLAQAIWAALGHDPPDGPAQWMRDWARDTESAAASS